MSLCYISHFLVYIIFKAGKIDLSDLCYGLVQGDIGSRETTFAIM